VIVSSLLARARRAAPDAAPGRAALTIGAVALATAGLAACSGSSGPTASSSPPAASPATSSPAAPASSSPAAPASPPPGSLDVCTAVTSAQVGTAMGGATVETTTGSAVGGNSACTYTLTIVKGDDASVEVVVGDTTAYAGFSGQVSKAASPPGSVIPVEQLGQQAVGSSVGIAILTPKHAILVLNERAAVGKLTDDISLAKILVAHIG
jgi:hypothetical protein